MKVTQNWVDASRLPAALETGETGCSAINLHCKNPKRPMSPLGHSRRFGHFGRMFALPSITT
jgi:hypothetical protein